MAGTPAKMPATDLTYHKLFPTVRTMNSLNDTTARALATTVAKTSDGISVKLGRTNGKPVLHLIQRQADDRDAKSWTIASEAEWAAHPAHKENQPRKQRSVSNEDEIAISEAIANKEAQ